MVLQRRLVRSLGVHFGWWAVAVFLLALTIRVGATAVFVGLSAAPRASTSPDQMEYEELAASLASGKGYTWSDGRPTAARPPGTPMALAAAYLVAGRSWLAGRVWFALLSAVTCLLLVVSMRSTLGPAGAVLAGLAMAVYPGHWYHSMHFLSEVPYSLCIGAFLACLVHLVRRPSPMLALTAGVVLGAAALVRPNAVVMLPMAGLLLVACDRRRFRAVALTAAMALTTALVTVPWLVRNQRVMGVATFSTVGGWTFWGAHNARVLGDPDLAGRWVSDATLTDAEHPLPGPTHEVLRSQMAWRYGQAFVREHLADMPYLVAMKIYRLLSPFTVTENRPVYWAFAIGWALTAPVMLLGLWRWWRHDPATAGAALVPMAGAVLAAAMFYGSVRFRDAVAPAIFACVGAVAIRPAAAPPHGTEAHGLP